MQTEKAAQTPQTKHRQNAREQAQSQNLQPVSDGSPQAEVLQQDKAVTCTWGESESFSAA